MIQLSPWALGTVDDLLRHLGKNERSTEADRDNAVDAGNHAIGWMQKRTRRKLRARTYRAAVSLTGTWTTAARTIAGSGFSASVKAGDPLLGVGFQLGTRVESVDSDAQLTISELPTAAGTGASFSAGTEATVLNGNGKSQLWLPEYPGIEVYSISTLDAAGNATALDLTGGYFGPERLTYVVPAGIPAGEANIALSYYAGYRPPSATVLWGDEWFDLNQLWLRVSEVIFLDRNTLMGRRTMRHVQNTDISYDWLMPADIERSIEGYARKP